MFFRKEVLAEEPSLLSENVIEYRECHHYFGFFMVLGFGGLTLVPILGGWGLVRPEALMMMALLPALLVVRALIFALSIKKYRFEKDAKTLVVHGHRFFPFIKVKKEYPYSEIRFEVKKRFVMNFLPRFANCVLFRIPGETITFFELFSIKDAKRQKAKLEKRLGLAE